MKTIIYFLAFSLILWIAGFTATYIIEYIVPLKILMTSYLSYIGIVIFFIIYAFIIGYFFNILFIEKRLLNYFLIGLIALLINLSLDIIFVFPLFPEMDPFSYPITYLGYSLIFLTPLLLFCRKSIKARSVSDEN